MKFKVDKQIYRALFGMNRCTIRTINKNYKFACDLSRNTRLDRLTFKIQLHYTLQPALVVCYYTSLTCRCSFRKQYTTNFTRIYSHDWYRFFCFAVKPELNINCGWCVCPLCWSHSYWHKNVVLIHWQVCVDRYRLYCIVGVEWKPTSREGFHCIWMQSKILRDIEDANTMVCYRFLSMMRPRMCMCVLCVLYVGALCSMLCVR